MKSNPVENEFEQRWFVLRFLYDFLFLFPIPSYSYSIFSPTPSKPGVRMDFSVYEQKFFKSVVFLFPCFSSKICFTDLQQLSGFLRKSSALSGEEESFVRACPISPSSIQYFNSVLFDELIVVRVSFIVKCETWRTLLWCLQNQHKMHFASLLIKMWSAELYLLIVM